jgi:hypothetical protein
MERLNELYQTWLKEQLIKAFELLDKDSDYNDLEEIITTNVRDFTESLEKTSTHEETLHIQEAMSGLEYDGWDRREWLLEVFNDTFYLWIQIKFWGEDWEELFKEYQSLKKN